MILVDSLYHRPASYIMYLWSTRVMILFRETARITTCQRARPQNSLGKTKTKKLGPRLEVSWGTSIHTRSTRLIFFCSAGALPGSNSSRSSLEYNLQRLECVLRLSSITLLSVDSHKVVVVRRSTRTVVVVDSNASYRVLPLVIRHLCLIEGRQRALKGAKMI